MLPHQMQALVHSPTVVTQPGRVNLAMVVKIHGGTDSLAMQSVVVQLLGAQTRTADVRSPDWLSCAVAPSSHSAPAEGIWPPAQAP